MVVAASGRVRGAVTSLFVGFCVVAACGGQPNSYGAAGIGLGATVLATGIHRAVTGSCWANCAKGFYCDHASGLCQRGECEQSCREHEYCVKEADGRFRCVAPAGTYAFGNSNPATSENQPAEADSSAPLAPFVDGAAPESESGDAGTPADGSAEVSPGPDAASDAAPEPESEPEPEPE